MQVPQAQNPAMPQNVLAKGHSHRPFKVLHHIGTTVSGTGVDTFVLQLAEAQKRLGIHAHISCDAINRSEFLSIAKERGFPFTLFPSLGALSHKLPQKIKTLMTLSKRVASLVKYLTENNIDLLHVHAVALSSLEAHLAAALTNTKILVTHHATIEWFKPMWNRQTDIILWLEKLRTKQVVCPYPKAADELRELGFLDERLFVVPFCADENKFAGSITLPSAGDDFKLITVSRLVEGKGHKYLLEAMAKLRAKYPNLRLIIAGDGPARPAIEADISRLGLSDIVKMEGHVHHHQIPELMQTAHCVLLPSYMGGETFPICLLEAMCLGMPCIGSRWFGIPDIIVDGKTGFIVEPKDADGLVKAIDALAGDLEFFAQASKAARERAMAEFTGEAVARSYAKLYTDAVGPRAALVAAPAGMAQARV